MSTIFSKRRSGPELVAQRKSTELVQKSTETKSMTRIIVGEESNLTISNENRCTGPFGIDQMPSFLHFVDGIFAQQLGFSIGSISPGRKHKAQKMHRKCQ